MRTTLNIEQDTIQIKERRKITSYWLRFMFAMLGIQSLFYWIKFSKSEENYDLIISVFVSILVLMFILREFFFRTNRDTIMLREIKKVQIQQVLFEKDVVNLKIKLKRKTREILITKDQAIKIKREIENLLQGTAANIG
jgi:hypothetical protein